MRRWVESAMVAVAVLSTTGCLSGFKHPLGPPSEGFIDKALLGSWQCRGTDDSATVDFLLDLTFVDFDGWQYLLQSDDHTSVPESVQVIATRVGGATFLSLRGVAPKSEDEWAVVRYSFVDSSHLSLGWVDPDDFEDVIDDRQAVRDRLATRLDDPKLVDELGPCQRL